MIDTMAAKPNQSPRQKKRVRGMESEDDESSDEYGDESDEGEDEESEPEEDNGEPDEEDVE